MARPLIVEALRDRELEADSQRSWVTLGTARAFAAAMSVLVISTFVVNRSANALDIQGAVTAAEVTSGTIQLDDDDNGRSLFDLAAMVPGRSNSECITITYGGSIVPVDLTLKADVEGDLGPYLDVTIEQGSAGGFQDCGRFTSVRTVFDGTLGQLAVGDGLALERILNQDESRVFRFTFTLQDRNEALGRESTVGFVWEVKPS